MRDDDPLRALDTLDRYGWKVRWVTDLGEDAVVDDERRLLLVDASVSRARAETALLRLTTQGQPRPAVGLLAAPAPCWVACPQRLAAR